MIKKSMQKGFTIIESTLAVAFLSLLLIAIVTLSIKAGNMYVKGNTNKAVNQAGRDIADTLRRDFLSADMNSVDVTYANDGGSSTSGRICVGSVTYLWNPVGLVGQYNDAEADAKPMNAIVVNNAPAYLVRATGGYCNKIGGRLPMTINNPSATDLLKGSGRDYALYHFNATSIAQDGNSGRGMYRVTFTIGTYDRSAVQRDSTNSYDLCKPNSQETADFNYCAVNNFDMIVRVGGGISS